MEPTRNPIAWTEIYVEDLQRAQKFYETVLDIKMEFMEMPEGMETDKDSENYFEMVFFPADMNSPGSGAAIVKSAMFKPGGSGTLAYFACEDCELEISKVAQAGGQVIQGKMSIGQYGFCGICVDTEGNTFGLHSMK